MQKSNIERKPVGYRLSPTVIKAIKVIAVNNDMQVNIVVEEALSEYIAKYGSGKTTVSNKVEQPATQQKPTPKTTERIKKQHNWPALLKEYEASGINNVTEFAKSKGINRSVVSENFSKLKAQETPTNEE